MGDSGSSGGPVTEEGPLPGFDGNAEITVEPKSRVRVGIEEVHRRWKHWLAIAATGVTTWFLYGINDTWSTDAIAFGAITLIMLIYTLTTLVADVTR